MATVCTGFDMYYENWHQDLYRLCLVLCRSPRDAGQLVFEAFLRLGAVRDRSIGEEEAKSLLFSCAIRLCDDYYLRRMRKRPSRAAMEACGLPFQITDALWDLMSLPFKKRAALCLMHAGFSPSGAARMAHLRAAPAASEELFAALSSIWMPQEDAQALSDRVYERFSERSVAFENRLHAMKSSLDHAAPYLALGVVALFLFAIWFSSRMA